jgi:hypothetical protein
MTPLSHYHVILFSCYSDNVMLSWHHDNVIILSWKHYHVIIFFFLTTSHSDNCCTHYVKKYRRLIAVLRSWGMKIMWMIRSIFCGLLRAKVKNTEAQLFNFLKMFCLKMYTVHEANTCFVLLNSWQRSLLPNAWQCSVLPNAWQCSLLPNAWQCSVLPNAWQCSLLPNAWQCSVLPNAWQRSLLANAWQRSLLPNAWQSSVLPNAWQRSFLPNAWQRSMLAFSQWYHKNNGSETIVECVEYL